MKKILSLLGSFGMVATASTSVIACNTDSFSMPTNPSNEEELLKLLKDNKIIFEEMSKLKEAAIKDGADFSSEETTPFFNEKWQKNDTIQKLWLLTAKYQAFDFKVEQYLLTLPNDEAQKKFVEDNKDILLSYNDYAAILPLTEEDYEYDLEFIDGMIGAFDNAGFPGLNSSTIKSSKTALNWAKENKFKA